jgi:hypothetical protein
MTDAGDPAAALAGIRERYAERIKTTISLGADPVDSARSIAALDAVLELHGPGPITILGSGSLCRRHESSRFFSITTAEADAIRACPDCAAATWVSCAGCGPSVDVDECPTRAVIARELTAERGDGA